LLSQAHANLAAVDAEIAELDAQRLELEPSEAVTKEIALAAARRDAERRIALIEQRAADELRQKQIKSQTALIGRVEAKFAERNEHIGRMCEHLANAVDEMKLAQAANSAAMAAWPWNGTRDNEPCLFGLFFRSAIRHELWRLSGDPFRPGVDFPGAENPLPFTNLDPKSVQPLAEKAAVASGYASRIMKEMPIRPLPPPSPPPAPIEVAASVPKDNAAAAEIPAPPREAPQAEYVYHVKFRHRQTGEQRKEEVMFGLAELKEASLDGLGATGPRAHEIATRIATERAGPEFVFDKVSFDLQRLMDTLNRD
jgi:hypothetical protein